MHEVANYEDKLNQKGTEVTIEEFSRAIVRRQALFDQRDRQNTEHFEAQLNTITSMQTDLAKLENNRRQDAEDARTRTRENQAIAANDREMHRNKTNREIDASREENRAWQKQIDTVRATRLLDSEFELYIPI
jgi:hypothetical protein